MEAVVKLVELVAEVVAEVMVVVALSCDIPICIQMTICNWSSK